MTKTKKIGMLALDLVLALLFVILFNKSAFGTLAFHEIAGLCFAGGLVAHIVINRKWIAGITKNFGAAPTKTKIEYILMWLLLADLAVMIVSGILISKVVFANIITARFNLQGLHTATAYLALMLMGLHIGLAWNKVLAMCRGISGGKKSGGAIDAVLRVAAVVIFAFGVYSMAATNYFSRAFSFAGSGHEQHEMLPDGGFDGQNGPEDTNGQSGWNSQDTQDGQSGQSKQNSQDTQDGQSETTQSGSAATTASTLAHTSTDTISSATVEQGSGDASLSGKGGGRGGFGGQRPDSGQLPSGEDGGQLPPDGQMPGNGQMPDGDNGGQGFRQMNGEGGGSTAATAAKNFSILGAFAVLAYYLEKLLSKRKRKTAAPAASAPETDASVPEENVPETAPKTDAEISAEEAPQTAESDAGKAPAPETPTEQAAESTENGAEK